MTEDGRFMVAVRVVLENKKTGKVLLVQNPKESGGKWRMISGRIKQGEEIEEAIRREAEEESGIKDLEIVKLMSVWHGYRGEKLPENELISITYWCGTNEEEVRLGDEHVQYKWVEKEEVLDYMEEKGFAPETLREFKCKKRKGGLCYLIKDQKVLLPLFDYGELGLIRNGISGFVEEGETVKQSMVREIEEEIGVEVKKDDLEYKKTIEISPELELDVFLLTKWKGDPKPIDPTIKDMKWFDLDNIPYDEMHEGSERWLPEVLES